MPWRRDRLLTPVFLGFPDGSDGKESSCNAGDLGLIPGLGRSPEEGMATHSCILAWRIPMDRGAWQATVHGVAKSWTWLKWLGMVKHSKNLQSALSLALGLLNLKYSKFEKEMATHSHILAWIIRQTEEPGGLESMGWKRVGHDWTPFTHSFKV